MAVTALPSAPALPRRRSAILDFIRQQPLGAASFVVIFVMMFAGIFAEYVAPYDPLAIDFAGILAAPSWDHWGGTDAYGRDILSRIIYGSRTALVIGFSSSFLGSTIGAILGIASAYFGGRIDDWIQRFVDILLAFPIIVLALVVVAALRKSVLFGIDVNLIYAIAIPIIPRVARVVRAAALSIRVMPYVDAARAAGYSNTRIIFRHMAPNVVAPYLIMLAADSDKPARDVAVWIVTDHVGDNDSSNRVVWDPAVRCFGHECTTADGVPWYMGPVGSFAAAVEGL